MKNGGISYILLGKKRKSEHINITVYEVNICKGHKKCGKGSNSQIAILTNNMGVVVIIHSLIILYIIITQHTHH